jgi:hypothetical protein
MTKAGLEVVIKTLNTRIIELGAANTTAVIRATKLTIENEALRAELAKLKGSK